MDGSVPVGAAAVGNGVAAVGSTEGDHTGRGPGCRGVSTARWTARPGTVDRDGDPADGLGAAEPDPATGSVEGVTTDAIGEEPDTNGATSIGSPSTSIRRCTVDGPSPTGAGVVGNGVTAVGAGEGDSTGSGSGSSEVSTARWTARPGTVDRDGDPADGPSSAEPDPAAGFAEGVVTKGLAGGGVTTGPEGVGDTATDAIGGVSDTSGATSSGSASPSASI